MSIRSTRRQTTSVRRSRVLPKLQTLERRDVPAFLGLDSMLPDGLLPDGLVPGDLTLPGILDQLPGLPDLPGGSTDVAGFDDVFVAGAYQLVLGREADAAGLDYWTGILDLTDDPSLIIDGIAASPEGFGNQVSDLYESILFRTADDDGLGFWVDQLLAGANIDDVESGFLGSDEFFQNAGGTVDDYLGTVYQWILDRPIDAGGADYWAGLIEDGLPLPMICQAIMDSPESLQGDITDAYESILGRPPEDGALDFWTSVPGIGDNFNDLIGSLFTSPEYLGNLEEFYTQRLPDYDFMIDLGDANEVAWNFIQDFNLEFLGAPGDSGSSGSDDASISFNHHVAISNLEGTYRGSLEAEVTIGGAPVPVRAEVTFQITNATPDSPDDDPTDGADYHFSGRITVRAAGFPVLDEDVSGVFSLTQFPGDPSTPQEGSITIFIPPGADTGAFDLGIDQVSGLMHGTSFTFTAEDLLSQFGSLPQEVVLSK